MNNHIGNRVEELESKLTFQEITVEEINQTVVQLQSEMTKLKTQLVLLSKKLQATQITNIAPLSEETLPPHY